MRSASSTDSACKRKRGTNSGLRFSSGLRARRHAWAVTQASLAVLLLVGGVTAADWPTFRSDNSRTGFTAEGISLPLKQSWGFSSPIAPKTAWSGSGQRVIERKELRDRVRFDDALQVAVVGARLFFGSSVDDQGRWSTIIALISEKTIDTFKEASSF